MAAPVGDMNDGVGRGEVMSRFDKAVRSGNLEEAGKLFSTGCVSEEFAGGKLHWAAFKGNIEAVRFLIGISDPKRGGSVALRAAALQGHLEVADFLIPLSDEVDYPDALTGAARQGFLQMVRRFVPLVDKKALTVALKESSEMFQRHVVDELVQLVDASIAICELRQDGLKEEADFIEAVIKDRLLLNKVNVACDRKAVKGL